ncbi:MAG: NAD(P)-dependent alcohol dehydrogenase [Ilumatobacter sp.]|uniref:NAD(P)-dependent alcohol dehydrogenase n=1 Tax=Ilumatobacter sp. TaxID=1967498 RepID=UPI003297AE85
MNSPDTPGSCVTTMRAVVAERFGSPSTLAVRPVALPRLAEGHVRVRVRAVSLNPADWHGVVGRPFIARPSLGLRSPKRLVPGTDIAGTVDEIGPGVTSFAPGDEVFGFVSGGGCAEYASVPEATLAPKPAAVSFDAAACAGVAAFTALQAVRDVARLDAGKHVLVNGATGGVGHFAVQIAKSMGGEVTAVCSTAHVDAARSLGADHVIDYSTIDFTTGSTRYDAILDSPGNRSLRDCRRVLEPDGVYGLIGGSKAPVLGPIPRLVAARLLGLVSSQRFALVFGRETPQDLDVLRAMLDDGSIRPMVSRTMSLDEVPSALVEIGHGHTLGKLVAHP